MSRNRPPRPPVAPPRSAALDLLPASHTRAFVPPAMRSAQRVVDKGDRLHGAACVELVKRAAVWTQAATELTAALSTLLQADPVLGALAALVVEALAAGAATIRIRLLDENEEPLTGFHNAQPMRPDVATVDIDPASLTEMVAHLTQGDRTEAEAEALIDQACRWLCSHFHGAKWDVAALDFLLSPARLVDEQAALLADTENDRLMLASTILVDLATGKIVGALVGGENVRLRDSDLLPHLRKRLRNRSLPLPG